METMTVRQGSSDDRIDVLERKVDEGFRHVEMRFEHVDQRFEQVEKQFEQVDKRFEGVERRMENGFKELRGEMKGGFDRIDARLDAFQRTLILFWGGMMAALIGLIGTQL
jgi:chromosome segregation ATPase